MAKEETILYPTSLALIPAAEFEQMKAGDREIGYAWGQTAQQASERALLISSRMKSSKSHMVSVGRSKP